METPPVHWMTTLFGSFFLSLFALSFFAWVGMVAAKLQGIRVLPEAEKRTVAPWGLIDILFTILMVFLLQMIFASLGIGLGLGKVDDLRNQNGGSKGVASIAPNAESPVRDEASDPLKSDALASTQASGEPEERNEEAQKIEEDQDAQIHESEANPPKPVPDVRFAALIQSSSLLAMLLATLWISMRCRVTWAHIGWHLGRIRYDLALGIGAIILFVPIMYVLMGAVTFGLDEDYSHPIFEMVGKNLWLIGFAFWMAVVVAPITEEFFFRVILQGYLEAMAVGRITFLDVLLGRSETEKEAPHETDAGESPPPSDSTVEGVADSGAKQVPYWPILVTGVLFGLAHFGYGMSWVPLTFLGLVLGWLYRSTHRIWPSLLVHVVVNSIAMAGLLVKIVTGTP